MSPTRRDFVARLFGRARPDVPVRGDAAALFEALEARPRNEEIFRRNVRAVLDRLTDDHDFPLTSADEHTIEAVMHAFFEAGPALAYSPLSMSNMAAIQGVMPRLFPTYAELMQEDDGAGRQWAYLSSEDTYARVRDLHRRNAIVPIVGDFAGTQAIRTIGAFLERNGARVSTFYTSNVEQYLFQNGGWRPFFTSVASLPIEKHAVFVRAFFPRSNPLLVTTGPPFIQIRPVPGDTRIPSFTMVSLVADVLEAFRDGRLGSYADLIALSDQP
jgi:hypothetical protein